jgi:hypothetical protein
VLSAVHPDVNLSKIFAQACSTHPRYCSYPAAPLTVIYLLGLSTKRPPVSPPAPRRTASCQVLYQVLLKPFLPIRHAARFSQLRSLSHPAARLFVLHLLAKTLARNQHQNPCPVRSKFQSTCST